MHFISSNDMIKSKWIADQWKLIWKLHIKFSRPYCTSYFKFADSRLVCLWLQKKKLILKNKLDKQSKINKNANEQITL